jgi:hypothetical protein
MNLSEGGSAEYLTLVGALRSGSRQEQAVWLNLVEEERIPSDIRDRFQRAVIDPTLAHFPPAERLEQACWTEPHFATCVTPSDALMRLLPAELTHYRSEQWLLEHDYLDSAIPGTVPVLELKPYYGPKPGKVAPAYIWCAFGADGTGRDVHDVATAAEICLRLGLPYRAGVLRRIAVRHDDSMPVYLPTSLTAGCKPPFRPQGPGRWGRTRDLRDDLERYQELVRPWPGTVGGVLHAVLVGPFDVSTVCEAYLEVRLIAVSRRLAP